MKYRPTKKEYKIRTINDLFKVATKDNLPYLIEDLRKAIEISGHVRDVVEAFSGKEEAEKLEMNEFVWIDDGKHDNNGIVIKSEK